MVLMCVWSNKDDKSAIRLNHPIDYWRQQRLSTPLYLENCILQTISSLKTIKLNINLHFACITKMHIHISLIILWAFNEICTLHCLFLPHTCMPHLLVMLFNVLDKIIAAIAFERQYTKHIYYLNTSTAYTHTQHHWNPSILMASIN